MGAVSFLICTLVTILGLAYRFVQAPPWTPRLGLNGVIRSLGCFWLVFRRFLHGFVPCTLAIFGYLSVNSFNVDLNAIILILGVTDT